MHSPAQSTPRQRFTVLHRSYVSQTMHFRGSGAVDTLEKRLVPSCASFTILRARNYLPLVEMRREDTRVADGRSLCQHRIRLQ